MNSLLEINVSQFGFHCSLLSVSIQFRLSMNPLCIFYLISFLSRIRFFYRPAVTPNTTLEGFPFLPPASTFGIHGTERRSACVSTHYMTSTAQRFQVIMAKFLPPKHGKILKPICSHHYIQTAFFLFKHIDYYDFCSAVFSKQKIPQT